MKKITYYILGILILTLFTFSTIDSSSNYKSEIAKIENLLVSNYKGKLSYKVNSLKGGLALMGYKNNSPEAAFWIKDNIIYAANGTAMAWTNNAIKYSPNGIDYFSVLKVVRDEEYIK